MAEQQKSKASRDDYGVSVPMDTRRNPSARFMFGVCVVMICVMATTVILVLRDYFFPPHGRSAPFPWDLVCILFGLGALFAGAGYVINKQC